MNSDVLIIGVVVGCVNYLFRYLPLRLRAGNARPTRRGRSACCWTPSASPLFARAGGLQRTEILHEPCRLLPTLAGFAVLGLAFWKTRSIILPTLLSALTYGVVWKIGTWL